MPASRLLVVVTLLPLNRNITCGTPNVFRVTGVPVYSIWCSTSESLYLLGIQRFWNTWNTWNTVFSLPMDYRSPRPFSRSEPSARTDATDRSRSADLMCPTPHRRRSRTDRFYGSSLRRAPYTGYQTRRFPLAEMIPRMSVFVVNPRDPPRLIHGLAANLALTMLLESAKQKSESELNLDQVICMGQNPQMTVERHSPHQ